MDGGARQEEMAQRFKREVKEKAPWRRVDQRLPVAGNGIENEWVVLSQNRDESHLSQLDALPATTLNTSASSASVPSHASYSETVSEGSTSFSQGDRILVMFYINHVFPYMFPHYRPCLSEGGTTWVLDMMVRSAVFRQTTLCQGTFFFCLAHGVSPRSSICETVFLKVKEALECLRQASEAMNAVASVGENLSAAVHLMTSVVQVMRFEIASLTFENCHAHLNGALALFEQMLQSQDQTGSMPPMARFKAVIDRLGPSAWIPPAEHIKMPSTEQAAFSFSTSLLLFDDVIASTVLQRRPRLHAYHKGLLQDVDKTGKPLIDLQAVIGCQNWVIVQIGEIAALDEWKQEARDAGRLSMMELVARAMRIKETLESHLQQLEREPVHSHQVSKPILDLLKIREEPGASINAVTSIWANAALAYLFTVVSGWQPANAEVQHYVGRVIGMISRDLASPDLIRAVVWPFCVAGCLAGKQYETQLRSMVSSLQPQMVFGTARKALQIMENAWSDREFLRDMDLAACFKSHGEMVLLV